MTESGEEQQKSALVGFGWKILNFCDAHFLPLGEAMHHFIPLEWMECGTPLRLFVQGSWSLLSLERWYGTATNGWTDLMRGARVCCSLQVPQPGKWLSGVDSPVPKGLVSQLCVCVIFVLSGLKLQFAEVKEGLRCWPGAVYGTVSILLLTPLAGFGLVFVPLEPPDLSLGLALFALMPMTLTSGVILTKQAEGNTPLALLFTVATNFIAVFTLPATVPLLVDTLQQQGQHDSSKKDINVSINGTQMLLNLTYSILIPLIVGKLLSLWRPVLAFANGHSRLMKHASAFFLIVIVWMSVSKAVEQVCPASRTSRARTLEVVIQSSHPPCSALVCRCRCVSIHQISTLHVEMVVATAALGVGLHLVYLALNAAFSIILRLPTREHTHSAMLMSPLAGCPSLL